MKKTFFAAFMAVSLTTPLAAAWTPDQSSTFVNNCVSRSLAMSNIRSTWPPYLIGQVCDCIRQTVEPLSTFQNFNAIFNDNQTRERAQQSVYVVATACVGLVRQQQTERQLQPEREPGLNGWEGLVE